MNSELTQLQVLRRKEKRKKANRNMQSVYLGAPLIKLITSIAAEKGTNLSAWLKDAALQKLEEEIPDGSIHNEPSSDNK